MKAIAALNDYESEVAVPLLTSKLHDSEFLVRSFVARGSGNQPSADSFAPLMQIMKFDDTPNVRSEAANSLSLFGRVAVSHLVLAFYQDDHWLFKRSILGAIGPLIASIGAAAAEAAAALGLLGTVEAEVIGLQAEVTGIQVEEPHPQPPPRKRGGGYHLPHLIRKSYTTNSQK